jgi:ABC-2 type transport system ATP-binding protein
MRQRLGIARAIIHRPEILLLDEPINGLDPVGIREVRELLKSLSRDEGVTIMISSHIISEIEHIADTIGIIANGTMVRETPMSALREECPNGLEDYLIEMMSGGKMYA